ncbi:hypothetical protein BAL199_30562 [alpha proteobacterium BAL199]|nr:hypothetical protein BAL199_30562 [alpha proteobacterium BAL199]
MTRMQNAGPEERSAFVRNPRPLISQAVEESLRAAGRLDYLSPAGEEEAIEAVAGPVLVETREYSERVTGIAVYAKPTLDVLQGSGTTWLPEYFTDLVVQALSRMTGQALADLCGAVHDAMTSGKETVDVAGQALPATSETLRALQVRQEMRAREEQEQPTPTSNDQPDDCAPTKGPVIIETKDNFEDLHWRPKRGQRISQIDLSAPSGIATSLKQHQTESLSWQMDAWSAGLPGVLNADEQGLGKTLQTIAFLRWLKSLLLNESGLTA